MADWYEDDFGEEEGIQEQPRDSKIDQAKEKVVAFIHKNRKSVYYIKQLQVLFVEVKNTWDYIPADELRVKLDMCKFLGIRPLFIWRFPPKTYMYEVVQRGGYGMIFKSHIYPLGHQGLVEEIKEGLGLECDSPERIPDGIMARFMKWHGKVAGV